ncbi:hypothetical protein Hanom_Chr15g01362541 [Helianthus anomalus]
MPFLAKPAYHVVSEHLRVFKFGIFDLVVTDDDEVIFIWEL